MKGYYNMRRKPPEVSAPTAGSTVATWHAGQDGYYKITGRIKDAIIRGGENIYPREIEDSAHEPQCFGRGRRRHSDENYGEVVGAFVILREGSNLNEDDLRDYCSDKIAYYKTPKHFFIVDKIPPDGFGKIRSSSCVNW